MFKKYFLIGMVIFYCKLKVLKSYMLHCLIEYHCTSVNRSNCLSISMATLWNWQIVFQRQWCLITVRTLQGNSFFPLDSFFQYSLTISKVIKVSHFRSTIYYTNSASFKHILFPDSSIVLYPVCRKETRFIAELPVLFCLLCVIPCPLLSFSFGCPLP